MHKPKYYLLDFAFNIVHKSLNQNCALVVDSPNHVKRKKKKNQIPNTNMKLLKILKQFKIPRWSTIFLCVFYVTFMLLLLCITFPSSLKSSAQNKLTKNYVDELKKSEFSQNELKMKEDGAIKRPTFGDTNTVILSNSIDGNKLLTKTFYRADLNKDSTLTVQELARYINGRVRDHVDMAIKTNPMNFAAIDVSPRDGLVTWDEYHAFFLKSRGLNDEYIKNHDEKKHIRLDRRTKEEMMRDKALWAEAARTDSFSLTLDEFLTFRHPESSVSNLLTLVDDLLRQFDEDGDDNLTLDEFSEVTADDLDDKWRKYIITKTMHERKEAFKRLVDVDNNGKANRSELLSYVDPRHPRHSLTEAASLFNLADQNNDQRLALDEMLSHADSFMRSKMISTYENFHDEF